MAEQNLTAPSTQAKSDRRLLTALKGLMVLFVLGLLLAGRADNAWPIVSWPMYSGYVDGPPGDSVTSWQLYAIDSQGRVYPFWEQDIYGGLPSGDGKRVMDASFSATGTQRLDALKIILGRVQTLLPDVEIAQLQYWRLIWRHVDGYQSPPFDAARPDERQLQGSIQVADLAERP